MVRNKAMNSPQIYSPVQLANYLNMGCEWAVGEISSHTMVMGAHSVIPLETADTLREML